MKHSLLLSALFVTGLNSALAATITTSRPMTVVDPITGVVQGTTTLVTGAVNGTLGVVSGVGQGTGNLLMGVGTATNPDHMFAPQGETNQVVTNLDNGAQYVVTSSTPNNGSLLSGVKQGVRYVITNPQNGKQYLVTGVKHGTMDVRNGNRVVRYQYVDPIVKPL